MCPSRHQPSPGSSSILIHAFEPEEEGLLLLLLHLRSRLAIAPPRHRRRHRVGNRNKTLRGAMGRPSWAPPRGAAAATRQLRGAPSSSLRSAAPRSQGGATARRPWTARRPDTMISVSSARRGRSLATSSGRTSSRPPFLLQAARCHPWVRALPRQWRVVLATAWRTIHRRRSGRSCGGVAGVGAVRAARLAGVRTWDR